MRAEKKRKRKRGKKKKEDNIKKPLWRVLLVENILPAGAIALFIITFVAQLYKIPSGSMRPTLMEGDRILVCKFIYGLRIPFSGRWLFQKRPPKRGDVVVFLYDKEPWRGRKNFIKRIIGTEGDTLEIKDGHIYINGELIDEPPSIPAERIYTNKMSPTNFYTSGKLKIPPGNYFVLGDNSRISKDSRVWGFVPLNKIRGKAICIVWPPSRIGLIR